jgi:hypothetical protein
MIESTIRSQQMHHRKNHARSLLDWIVIIECYKVDIDASIEKFKATDHEPIYKEE